MRKVPTQFRPVTQDDLTVEQVHEPGVPSPLRYAGADHQAPIRYRSNHDRVAMSASFNLEGEEVSSDEEATSHGQWPPISFERAGPRQMLAFDPKETTAAVVTCGGLCPGLNDVIRALAMCLRYHYGVERVFGIRYGYAGLADPAIAPLPLSKHMVSDIHKSGGTILGTSRGFPPIDDIMAGIRRLGINMLFTIGGDGTQRGAHDIHLACRAYGMDVAVIGIPKTIDNDVAWVDQTFGFDTAVGIAADVVEQLHIEAKSVRHGIGMAKLMGRDAGHIAAAAALASGDANVVLVPEVPFELDGPHGLLNFLERRWQVSDHTMIVVAEGAGQHLFGDTDPGSDHSGNPIYQDIGLYLRDRIMQHFAAKGDPVSVKYVDPSYLVRSGRANAADSIFCIRLAHNAVHAAMAGRTDMMIGRWYGKFTHVPLPVATGRLKVMNPRGSVWRAVLENTGQPAFRNHREDETVT